MTRLNIGIITVGAALAMVPAAAAAQSHEHPNLHVGDRWEECAFQLHPSLTQSAWRQFTREAAMVTYFRPLRDAAPMGRGNFEISIMQSVVGIDDHDAAWNDTFVHPDSTHWLFEGDGLPIPGLMARVGVTDRLDVGAYFTMNPKANYGFAGGQVQYNFVQQASAGLDASARASLVTMFGPEDVGLTVYGLDLIASRRIPLHALVSISPYVGVSGYVSMSDEKSEVVDLRNETVAGVHALAGAVARLSNVRVAVEYDAANVNSRTIKVGLEF